MERNTRYTVKVALIVALGGFLMGFDASVISGVVGFIEPEFSLSKIELGWAVASLTLTATLAMMVAGPLSDRVGRRPVLTIAAILFAISAVASALAPNFITLVLARMLGGCSPFQPWPRRWRPTSSPWCWPACWAVLVSGRR
jgi:MFS family permease